MLPYPASSGTFSASRSRNISQAAAPEAPSGSSTNTTQSYPEIEPENPHHDHDRRCAFADASICQSRPPAGNVTRAAASPLTSANPDDGPSHDQVWPPFGIDSVDVICETLGKLEQLANELRDMDHVIPPRPPTRRLVRPPPRISSLHALRFEQDSYESLPDSRRSSFDSSDGYHSPLLNGHHHLAYLRDDVSTSEDGLQADIPRIVLTVPSSEELFRRHQTPPIEVDLMFAEESMDVMEWLDEYGLWTDSGAEEWSDDSDSDTSSLFVYASSETSSIHTSPPNSPGIQTPKVSVLVSHSHLATSYVFAGFPYQALLHAHVDSDVRAHPSPSRGALFPDHLRLVLPLNVAPPHDLQAPIEHTEVVRQLAPAPCKSNARTASTVLRGFRQRPIHDYSGPARSATTRDTFYTYHYYTYTHYAYSFYTYTYTIYCPAIRQTSRRVLLVGEHGVPFDARTCQRRTAPWVGLVTTLVQEDKVKPHMRLYITS